MIGEALDFLDLVSRLPPMARPALLIERRQQLENEIAEITKLLEGEVVQDPA